MKTPMERFMEKISPEPNTGCWFWAGSVDSGGYGTFYYEERIVGAHRAGYLMMVGSIPEKMDCDHLCRQRSCVNPDHIEIVTRRTNVLRGILGDVLREKHAAITHCVHGHEYTPENTYRAPGTPHKRTCRVCMKRKNDIANEKRKRGRFI